MGNKQNRGLLKMNAGVFLMPLGPVGAVAGSALAIEGFQDYHGLNLKKEEFVGAMVGVAYVCTKR